MDSQNINDIKLKEQLIESGMRTFDADTLIKIARTQKKSVTRVFLSSLSGLYMGIFALLLVYLFFVYKMKIQEIIIFSYIYLSIFAILYFFTHDLKTFFWSIKILFKLKGR